jgi:hypothetical protein
MKPLYSVSLCQGPYPPNSRNVRVQAHVGCWAHCLRNEHGDNETVDCNDTGHNNGDERLQSSTLLAIVLSIEPATLDIWFHTFMMRSAL